MNSKFLGNANGLASTPQQSKLTFGKPKSASTAGKKEIENEAKVVKNEDEDSDVEMKAAPEDTESDGKPKTHMEEDVEIAKPDHDQANSASPTTSPRSPKRSHTKIEEIVEDDDDEPVRKRSRKERTSKSSSKEANAEQSTKPRKKPKSSEAQKRDTTNTTSPEEKKSPKRHIKAERKNSAKTAAENDEPMDEEPAAEHEEDNAESDEDEKPEVAAKARAKVQATLKSSDKDPFPDWKPGEPVPYAALCTTFSLVEMTTKRLIISAHCSLFLRQVLRLTPQDLLPTIQLMVNKLAADYAGIELGIGESLIMKAIGEATGRSLQVIKADQHEIGDLGLVAAKSRGNQPTMFKPKPLTVRSVRDGLMSIATTSGGGSQTLKISGIKKLLSAADSSKVGKGIDITENKGGPSEAKFIIRFLEGKLRLGLAEKTVLVAIAHAFVMHETAQTGGKIPSSDKLAEGESILKTVYRFVQLASHYLDLYTDCDVVSSLAGKSLFLQCSSMVFLIFATIASCNQVFL